MEWPRMDVDQGPGLLWAKVTLGEEGRRMVVESGPRHQVQPPPSVGANHPAHLPTCGKWSIQWMKLHSQDIICVYLYKTMCHKTPAIPHQAFMWTVENIITYALGKHDLGSAQNGRTWSEMLSSAPTILTSLVIVGPSRCACTFGSSKWIEELDKV